jgi:hypothetical protein
MTIGGSQPIKIKILTDNLAWHWLLRSSLSPEHYKPWRLIIIHDYRGVLNIYTYSGVLVDSLDLAISSSIRSTATNIEVSIILHFQSVEETVSGYIPRALCS